MDIVAKCEISRVLLLMLLEVKTCLFSLNIFIYEYGDIIYKCTQVKNPSKQCYVSPCV